MYGKVLVILVAAALLPLAYAQEKVNNLRDLEGIRADDGMREMRDRGYSYVKTDGGGRDQYAYFRESRSDRCVTVHIANGRYDSLVYAPDSDCGRGGGGGGYNGGGGNVRELNDLVGARGGDGEYQMKQRGYRLEDVDKGSDRIVQYWSKNRDCVQVTLYDGRYDAIDRASSRNCGGGGGGGRPNYGGGNVDYPRVNVDTAGRGTYRGPGFDEPRIDRGYVNTRDSRVAVGMSVKDGFKIMLYGRITRRNSDREFEMAIEDSDNGRASGRATFRLNKDKNEVEMIDFNARIGRDNVSGRFNRS